MQRTTRPTPTRSPASPGSPLTLATKRSTKQNESAFATSNVEAFAEAANSLENTAAATHTELLADYESVNARKLTASILVVEARMATVLSNLGGLSSSLTELFEPEAEPLELTSGVVS